VWSGVGSAAALPLPEPYVHLSAHTALYSTLAQGHGDIMIAGGDGVSEFVPVDVGISLRVPPPELHLLACDQSSQRLADGIALIASTVDQPRLRLAGFRHAVPFTHQRLDTGPVLLRQPVRHFPEHDGVDAPEPCSKHPSQSRRSRMRLSRRKTSTTLLTLSPRSPAPRSPRTQEPVFVLTTSAGSAPVRKTY